LGLTGLSGVAVVILDVGAWAAWAVARDGGVRARCLQYGARRVVGLGERPVSRRRRGRACALAALVTLAACGGGGDGEGGAGQPSPQPGPAPEPAEAPAPAAPPAGTVISLPGGAPEGVVADPVSGVVAVALRKPSRLALIDIRTAQVTRVIPVPGAARHLQLVAPGGPVIVPGEDSDVVAKVDLRSGDVLMQTKVGRQPHDAAAVDGRLYVADELGGTTTVVSPDGAVGPVLPGPVSPGGVAVAAGRVGVVDVRGAQLFVYDAATARPLGQLPAGNGPTHVVPDGSGGVVVSDTRGDALLFFRLGPEPQLVRRVPLKGSPYGLAIDMARRRLWVTLTATNQLTGFDLSGAADQPFITLPAVRQPNTVAVDAESGRVYVAGAAESNLQVVDPR